MPAQWCLPAAFSLSSAAAFPLPLSFRYALIIARHDCAAPFDTWALPVRIQYGRAALL